DGVAGHVAEPVAAGAIAAGRGQRPPLAAGRGQRPPPLVVVPKHFLVCHGCPYFHTTRSRFRRRRSICSPSSAAATIPANASTRTSRRPLVLATSRAMLDTRLRSSVRLLLACSIRARRACRAISRGGRSEAGARGGSRARATAIRVPAVLRTFFLFVRG